MTAATRPAIVVSRCLLGERVRYDGGDKAEPETIAALASRFALIPVCPEVEAGMPVPREPMDFFGDPRSPSVIGAITRRDHARLLLAWSLRRIAELAQPALLAQAAVLARVGTGGPSGPNGPGEPSEDQNAHGSRPGPLAVCGFLLKRNSPSCAVVARKPVRDLYGQIRGEAFGVFAGLALRAFPGAAFGDEATLSASQGREAFMDAAMAYFHRTAKEEQP